MPKRERNLWLHMTIGTVFKTIDLAKLAVL